MFRLALELMALQAIVSTANTANQTDEIFTDSILQNQSGIKLTHFGL